MDENSIIPALRDFKQPIRWERLEFIVGKSDNGETIVESLGDMQHLLIAGAPGMGKSTLIHSMILSLMKTESAQRLSMQFIDSKSVELSMYSDSPFLFYSVISDPKGAAGMLLFWENEMRLRLEKIRKYGCRSFSGYNDKKWEDGADDSKMLPAILIVIDGLDTLTRDKSVAQDIADRLSSLIMNGRAVGIHIVAAVQSITEKPVSGLVPMFPSRIAFGIHTKAESKKLIDSDAAASLSSPGECIMMTPKSKSKCVIHTFLVSDYDIINTKADTLARCEGQTPARERMAVYEPPVPRSYETSAYELGKDELDNETDEMCDAAVDVILETGQASVSMLQRRLKLGYARAVRIVDEMEEKGVVGPFQGSVPRAILITKEQWAAMHGRQIGISQPLASEEDSSSLCNIPPTDEGARDNSQQDNIPASASVEKAAPEKPEPTQPLTVPYASAEGKCDFNGNGKSKSYIAAIIIMLAVIAFFVWVALKKRIG